MISLQSTVMADQAENTFPLLTYLDSLVEDLQKDTPKALREFDVDAIHDSRVATRRLKAATELLAPVFHGESSKKFEKALKKLRRSLGPLRDGDVMIEHLSDLKSETHAPAVNWLKDVLTAQRDEARANASRTGPGKVLSKLAGWWELRDAVAESRDAVDSLLAQSVHLRLDAFIELTSQKVNPHELRIAGKSLRYTLEMAAEQGHKLPKSVLKTFKAIQEYLGAWHDNVVIVQTAMSKSLAAELVYKNMPLQQQLLNLSRLFATRAEKEFAKFEKMWISEGEDLATRIREAFPLTTPVTEPKTDLDLPRSEESVNSEATPSDAPAGL